MSSSPVAVSKCQAVLWPISYRLSTSTGQAARITCFELCKLCRIGRGNGSGTLLSDQQCINGRDAQCRVHGGRLVSGFDRNRRSRPVVLALAGGPRLDARGVVHRRQNRPYEAVANPVLGYALRSHGSRTSLEQLSHLAHA
ncbi:hypothetical protein M409DRAFT_58697 [Zasmidium cellare ATCC 36951]|uniref:Uncharacterized protein n=1 Tax=Zasmidium cellare ATCC 36951 TaxID=1080233 RepID=A0A6A6C4G6_ZASCE|nr:uncharacterized protein M409DRAFT_58697 [Zasmidium cellare ATCC 36951]KAF2161921.1 hypothetical protein M409DRAFT_58697 [Zasmidium cellare ATCC 36951]